MITVKEAQNLIAENIIPLPKVSCLIDELGEEVLAETLIADRNIPPFSRVAMDGVALSFKAWKEGRRSFIIESFQAAGENPGELGADSEH